MKSIVTLLDDDAIRECAHERARPFPNPFDQRGPSALARVAAEQLQAEFKAQRIAPGLPSSALERSGKGKMFGVLVVALPDGRLGFLRAFSGMFTGRWELPGFVPPVFDREARARIETVGEAKVKALTAESSAAAESNELTEARRSIEEMQRRQVEEAGAMRALHRSKREARSRLRSQARSSAPKADSDSHSPDAVLEELAGQSRADKTERRRLTERHEAERAPVAAELQRLEHGVAALDQLRRDVSQKLMVEIHNTYRVENFAGETCGLRELYPNGEPPSGAADCAAPKLLAYAYRTGLKPIALAEFWFGAPPTGGGRISGVYYPSCRGKCGPLLPFMLRGLDVASLAMFTPPDSGHLELRTVFEDEHLVVVDKPSGLLSVPSSNEAITDSVVARLKLAYPTVSGQMVVHRLDMDTSGLLVAARDPQSFARLSRQFATQKVTKRYVAWVDGDVAGDEGVIDLALRVDLDDRPRHIFDPKHGKPARTEWKVLEHKDGRTRVEFRPLTGRTHQLRVHAAHPAGLGSPIVGDPLYGHGGERLCLHAEAITLRHPASGEVLSFESPAPF